MAPKEKWGTIKKCPFPLGYQKLTRFEIELSVDSLSKPQPTKTKTWWNEEWKHPKGDQETIDRIVTKLTDNASKKVPDSRRIAEGAIHEMGIVNSFAWKGYN